MIHRVLPRTTAGNPLWRSVHLAVLILAGVVGAQAQSHAPSRLRDITVTVDGNRAEIVLLMSSEPRTVVTETRDGTAQVRLRSVAADDAALRSARRRPGVRSVAARIERKDVLVVDAAFERRVRRLRVVRRSADRVVVAVELAGRAGAPGATADESRGETGATPRSARQWTLSTIVIDPGHGGRDPGAIGIGGVREKDLTLAVATHIRRELRKQLPGVRVVMTRDSDEFVELDRRGQIANERDGRLFISIHCNSLPDSSSHINGFECYILRPGRSDEAARVVAAENSAVRFERDSAKYSQRETESTIVATMAQSSFARYSEIAAEAIRVAMRKGTPMKDRGVLQAGFYVLVGASMPAVLVELGYISNPHDARALSTVAGRRKIAQAIVRGIVRYRTVYNASLR